MNRTVSLLISTIFHPVFINLLSLISLMLFVPVLKYGMSDSLKLFYLIFIFTLTGILPIGAVSILKYSGNVKSFLLQEKKERMIPYIITAVLYLFTYYLSKSLLHSQHIIIAYLLACSCIVAAVMFITIFDKISIHMASIGAFAAIVVSMVNLANFDVRILLAIILVFAGLTATARMFANSHLPYQLYCGFFLGFIIMYFII